MRDLIIKTFAEQGFKTPQSKDHAYFFEKEQEDKIEYYLVDFIEGRDLKGYLESQSGQTMFALFEENRKEKGDVEKNTSLVLCIKVSKIDTDLQAIKNEILAIEENDYWFRKYTIIYTDTGIFIPNDSEPIVVQLNRLLLEEGRFKSYKSDIYKDEIYFLAIQMFIKLPFLLISQQSQINYRSIYELMKEQLTEDEMMFRENLRTFEELDNEEGWKVISAQALDSSGSDDLLRSFIIKFGANA
ncbi:hypothetical protein FMM05_19515 [Flavobacterium zepuense]|uniref:Uncharacterized protein n=1 Tax=Flavobacterium zepuense TaxID=2593302 RepID=A0A552UUR7_9FLAO|nr:ABC-three component system middle component 1 [Flavobacterium zepuense]TRW21976.1 hypothetical protein FMM05_19515 [Flavobacterium zepuense]